MAVLEALPTCSLALGCTSLTPRELSVLTLIARGFSNRGIAAQLFVSEKTVEAFNRTIFLKLGLGFEDAFENRRVKAVLAFQGNQQQESPCLTTPDMVTVR
jgi:DNA-binding NarL/FixJ family response regulator